MIILFLSLAAFSFFFFWRWAHYFLKPFPSTYLGLALWFLYVAVFGAVFHFWR